MTKKVVLITTGGTIASKRNTSGKLESGVLDGNEILSMCNLQNDIEIILIDLFHLPSMHMSFDNLNTLTQNINEQLKDETVNGIVVTHGTDSLEETAYFLELTTNDARPIVVTGSQKSPEDIGTDVYSNLRNSILVASNENANNLGSVVVFNDEILHSKYVKKIHSSSINGFGSIGYGRLGFIDNDEVVIYQKPTKRECYDLKEVYPNVEIVSSYLGCTGFVLDALYASEIDGIVLVGSGRGQITPSMTKSLKSLLEKNVKIVLTTSTEEGRVFPSYDYYGSANNLKEIGVVMGGDFDAKKARIKLMLMLANNNDLYDTFMH